MMRRATFLAAMTIGLLAAQTAAAQAPVFDPRSWKRDVAGPETQVLVLGSSHLSNLKGFQPAWMTATLDAAHKATGLDQATAVAQMEAMLATWPAARHPGARVLSVVGSSHKTYFDMMHEVQLVDAEAILR